MEAVRETVEFGHVRAALDANFISLQQLIDFLAEEQNASDEHLVAWVWALRERKDGMLYASDGRHLLRAAVQEEYGALYIMLSGNVNAPITADRPDTSVASLLVGATAKLFTDRPWMDRLYSLAGQKPEPDALSILAGHHVVPSSGPWIRDHNWLAVPADPCAVACLRLDSFEQLCAMKGRVPDLLKRCQLLATRAPGYWAKVAKPIYARALCLMVKRMTVHDDSTWVGVRAEDLAALDSLFPYVLPPDWLRYSPLALKLSTLSLMVQAYLLGFPIEFLPPKRQHIDRGLLSLSELGPDEYCRRLAEHYKRSYGQSIPDLLGPGPELQNEQNTLTESPWDYVSFDRAIVCLSSRLYAFTREEFEKLLETQKNFYTNEKLPEVQLDHILQRQFTARRADLPAAGPLRELLRQVEENRLVRPPDVAPTSEVADALGQALFEQLLGLGHVQLTDRAGNVYIVEAELEQGRIEEEEEDLEEEEEEAEAEEEED